MLAVTAMAVTVGSCAGVSRPLDRVAEVFTTGCGHAFDGGGSGVVVGPGLVLTAAHVVAQADAIRVVAGDAERDARVVGYQPRSDLALLSVPGLEGQVAELAAGSRGDTGTIVGGSASGDVPYTILRVVDISIPEVLGTARSLRVGYELEAGAAHGDSGAGLFDDRGRLVGVLFAVDSDGSTRAWATASSEVKGLLDAPRVTWRCRVDRSRLVPG